jgi:hypothetical protein
VSVTTLDSTVLTALHDREAQLAALREKMCLTRSQLDQTQVKARWEHEIDRLPTKEFSSTDKTAWRRLCGPLANTRNEGITEPILLLVSEGSESSPGPDAKHSAQLRTASQGMDALRIRKTKLWETSVPGGPLHPLKIGRAIRWAAEVILSLVRQKVSEGEGALT